MGKIFCVMGKSSSGKDTIYKRVLEREELGLKRIVPYTTRPIRKNEAEGVEYHFVDAERRDALMERGKIIEIRSYNTIHGVWDYFTVDDGEIDLEHQDYLLIGTLDTYEKLRKYYGFQKICPIYIEVEDGVRLERALQRERKQTKPKYEEMCRRFLADQKDFSEDRIKALEITEVFQNDVLEDTVETVVEFIKAHR